MRYQRLFQPINIHGMELKNRIVMPPMHLIYSTDGSATDRFKEFYYRRAEGGAGLVICGGCSFDDYGGTFGMISLQRDELIPGFQAFTNGMHARGTKVAVQLYHGGRYSSSRFLADGKKPISASATTSTFTHEQAREMTRQDIQQVIKHWAAAAARAKAAGFDAVEILGSAGYLICQFLSPLTNLRTDEYGGSWENRVRFPLEVIAAVRQSVGPDYPLIMRIAGNDFIPGSNTNREAVEFSKLIAKAGINMINVTGGWHETVVPQLPGEVPLGCFTYLAEAVKNAVPIPVLACNRLNTPELCEEVLAMGQSKYRDGLDKELECESVIHMDPVEAKDELVLAMKKDISEIVMEVNGELTIHDFRVVAGDVCTNLVFDVAVSPEFVMTEEEIRAALISRISEIYPAYHVVIKVETVYI